MSDLINERERAKERKQLMQLSKKLVDGFITHAAIDATRFAVQHSSADAEECKDPSSAWLGLSHGVEEKSITDYYMGEGIAVPKIK
jgi:hypothetical protein